MPLENEIIATVTAYVDRDLPDGIYWYLEKFDFIDDKNLRDYLANEFYSARYIYKLMEALNASNRNKEAHVKFQIIQYASIYEAVICYLLWKKFSEHIAVKRIEFHSEYREVTALSSKTKILYDSEYVYICRLKKDVKTPEYSIKFDDKVNAAVEIGFVNSSIGEDIKEIYKLRNNVHTSKAAKDEFEFEIQQSKLAYERMEPFIADIKAFVK